MLSEQVLTKRVLSYLKENDDVRLNLPNLYCSIDSKVSLKYLKAFPIASNQNRYRVLISKTDELLKKNLLNLDRIKAFADDFFSTVSEDIVILEENEKLRRKGPSVKERIKEKNEEMDDIQINIESECRRINDKEDIVFFITGSLKSYINRLNVIANEYKVVNSIEILTSINIDELYREEITDEEDYGKHFEPMLEVLHKLKSNMMRLYQEIEQADPYDIPLRCINFLANCKNLIFELEPFLLNDDCAFNRLIFFAVKTQKDNLELVAANYEKSIIFCREVISDVFKSYFLAFIFKDHSREIAQTLEESRQNVYRLIENHKSIESTDFTMLEAFKGESLKLQKCLENLKGIKRMIAIGKEGFMEQYVKRKKCKKMNILTQYKKQCNDLQKLIAKIGDLSLSKRQIKTMENKQIDESSWIIKQVKMIEKYNEVEMNTLEIQSQNSYNPQKGFETTFLKIQENILQVSTLKQMFKNQMGTQESNQEILHDYVADKVSKLTEINHNYLELETKLLNSYKKVKDEKKRLNSESAHIKERTLEMMEEYFGNLKSGVGHEICNEDRYCEDIKSKIMDISRAEYMVVSYLKTADGQSQSKEKELSQLKYYRSNLEWLLIMFEGSMDEKILEMMMDKLDFEAQDYKERVKKVQELTTEIAKYMADLRKIVKSTPASQILQKVFKFLKDRIQLYEVIEDVYVECSLVFRETKAHDNLNIENHGLTLFSEPVYKYVLMLYQFSNKIRTEIQELSELLIPNRSKNYLIEEIFEPFSIRFSQYVSFKEQELLNFTLRLEHSLNIEHSQRSILQLFEKTLTSNSENYRLQVESVCREMVQLKRENTLVLQLQSERVVVHNLLQFREMIEQTADYYKLAELIIKEITSKQGIVRDNIRLSLKVEFRNSRVQELRKRVLELYNQNGVSESVLKSQSSLKRDPSEQGEANSNKGDRLTHSNALIREQR